MKSYFDIPTQEKSVGVEFNFGDFNEEFSESIEIDMPTKNSNRDDNKDDLPIVKTPCQKQTWRYCTNCNVEAVDEIEHKLVCPVCGMEIVSINDKDPNYTINKYYNTSGNSSVTTKIEGKNSYSYNKSLRSTCSDYKIWNSTKSLNKLNKLSYEAEDDKIPHYINEAVIKQFEEIRKKKTFRGTGQDSVKAALVYYKCQEEGIARKPYKIAALHNILERDLSKADSIVRAFHEDGTIDLYINHDNYESYVEKYMELLGIEITKWKPLIVDVIRRAEQKHIYTKTPKPSTKVMGAIYLLVNSVPALKRKISKEDIIFKCTISKTTLINHYQELLDGQKKLKKIYRKYKIKFPNN